MHFIYARPPLLRRPVSRKPSNPLSRTKASPAAPALPNKAKPVKAKPAAKSAATQLLDINTATEDELRALKGVGDIRAANIIKNRPYKGKDELVQKNIIPAAIYAGIKDKIIAKQQ